MRFSCFSYSLPLSLTHSHTLTLYSLTHSLSLILTLTLSLILSVTLPFILSFSLTLPYSLTLSHTYSTTFTNSHSHSLLTHSICHSLSVSLSLSHSFSHSLTLYNFHSLTYLFTFPLTFNIILPPIGIRYLLVTGSVMECRHWGYVIHRGVIPYVGKSNPGPNWHSSLVGF